MKSHSFSERLIQQGSWALVFGFIFIQYCLHRQCEIYHKVLNKRSCLNKRTPITFWRNATLKIGENWPKISKNGSKTSKMFLWTTWIHQDVCQRAGSVYSALYGKSIENVSGSMGLIVTI